MFIRFVSRIPVLLLTVTILAGCATSRQIVVDHPSIKTDQFKPLAGFPAIDGDDYYMRLISEFDYKGDNVLKSGCTNMTPSYEKGDLSAALIYNIRNDRLKLNREATGFLYQSTTGKCNFSFDAKKLYLTPWMRLDSGKETMVDYNFYTNANSDVDIFGLVNDVNKASNLLALTGVGMGVALMGQVAEQWVKNTQQAPVPSPGANPSSLKHSSESHSLPVSAVFSGNNGTLNRAIFKIYEVAEGGVNMLSSDAKQLGELAVYSEVIPSLLLKLSANGIPDARDSSFEEIGVSPIKSTSGEITLLQLIEQSNYPAKPNLQPDWNDYEEVENNCRKLKVLLKDLGFNKFDRNAVLYYFLSKNRDWQNYNNNLQKLPVDEVRPKTIDSRRNKNFGNCFVTDDYDVMKAMGLPVNTENDWRLIGEASRKEEQALTPLKAIERQLLAVLKNPNRSELEQQLFPLLNTKESGNGTVLLQNHLGEFGLAQLINAEKTTPEASDGDTIVSQNNSITGEGIIVNAKQLAQVFAGLPIDTISCARPAPNITGQAINSIGIFLFAFKDNIGNTKGGALEFEFSAGKINRLSFQLPTYRDYEQDVSDRPELGGCRIESSLFEKLH